MHGALLLPRGSWGSRALFQLRSSSGSYYCGLSLLSLCPKWNQHRHRLPLGADACSDFIEVHLVENLGAR